MDIRWIGSIAVITACSSFGYILSGTLSKETAILRHLIHALEYIGCELRYKRSMLPELCISCGGQVKGLVGNVMMQLGQELDRQILPDVKTCMSSVLQPLDIPNLSKRYFMLLGESLGHFDMEGQLRSLSQLQEQIAASLEELERDKAQRLRLYRTLGICAGVALVIFLC